MILAIILYRQLHKEIGQKSLKNEGFSDLGMSVMNVDLIAGDILPVFRQSSTTLSKSFPRMSKNAM